MPRAADRPLAPLGPRLTAHELGPCIDNLGSDLLLTEPEFLPLARELAIGRDIRIVVLDEPPRSQAGLDLDPSPDATAFVLHTSGTTGVPKAVPYRQDRLAQRTRVNAALCSLGPGGVYATASPFHHIAGFGNHAVALAAGAALAPLPRFTVDALGRARHPSAPRTHSRCRRCWRSSSTPECWPYRRYACSSTAPRPSIRSR